MLKIVIGAFVAISLVAIGAGIYENRKQHAIVVQPISQPARGESFYGFPSDFVDNTRVDPNIVLMQPKSFCSWGRPGSNPWKGDSYSALLAFNVHARVAREIIDRIGRRAFVSVVYASNKEVVSESGLTFSPWMGMTFGHDLCYGSRVNFVDGHREEGKLYTGIDENGGVYYIVMWEVCGNITRLIPMYEASRNRQFHGPLLVPHIPREAQPYAPLPWGGRGKQAGRTGPNGEQGEQGGSGGGDTINSVPEPDTMLLLLVGIPFILWRMQRGNKRNVQDRS